MSTTHKSLVKHLYEIADSKGMTTYQIEKKGGPTAKAQQKWRSGETLPSLDAFVSVCIALGVKIELVE